MIKYFTTGQVAKKLRISVSTLKRWLNKKDVKIPEMRNENGWRIFTNSDIETLKDYKKKMKKNGRRYKETTLIPIIKKEI